MSWLFAFAPARAERPRLQHLRSIIDPPLAAVERPALFAAGGGLGATFRCRAAPDAPDGWMLAGLGIADGAAGPSMLDADAWDARLRTGPFDPSDLDGHFAMLRWRGGDVECFTDQLGLRTLFYGESEEGVCISTRLDWVARALGRDTIDFGELGERWLLFNAMRHVSCVQGIERLGPGGELFIRDGMVVRSDSTPWLPRFGNADATSAVERLERSLACAVAGPVPVSLGLSGGLDSRVLVALLERGHRGRYATHTFGHPLDPDVAVAARIGDALGADQSFVGPSLPDAATLAGEAARYAAETHLCEPVSSIGRLRGYEHLRARGAMLVDGGLGELARRRYLVRLARRGRAALEAGDVEQMLPHLRFDRAAIFSPDVQAAMLQGCRDGLRETLHAMPPLVECGLGNYLDLLAVRTRLPNYASPEQARLDALLPNMMPFAQLSFLAAVFAMDISLRDDGRFVRDVVRACTPALARVPLVSHGATYPFAATTAHGWAVLRLKQRLRRTFIDHRRDACLSLLKPLVLDLLHAPEARSFAGYDRPRIFASIMLYYSGDTRQRDLVDWWLTFEIWRRSLKRPVVVGT